MGLLRRMVAEHPDVPVIMITAHGSVDSRRRGGQARRLRLHREAVRADPDPRRSSPRRSSSTSSTSAPRARPSRRPRRRRPLRARRAIAGRCEQVFGIIEKVADTPSTVLITGESGTGKELIARALHDNSSRKAGAVHQDQLRRDPQDADGVGAVRLREGRLHRRRRLQAGPLRAGRRRHPVPRRDRRDPRRDAGQAPARPAGVGVRARRRHQDHQGRRAPGDGDQPRPAEGGRGRQLPRGPLLPPERRADPPAAAARAARATFRCSSSTS